jgi:hypothetical protein
MDGPKSVTELLVQTGQWPGFMKNHRERPKDSDDMVKYPEVLIQTKSRYYRSEGKPLWSKIERGQCEILE